MNAVPFRITPAMAQRIVEAAAEVSSHDVNFISSEGMIFASTDVSRIGTFHEAGKLAYEHGRVTEVEPGSGFLGARPGINYPIILDGRRLGVIGISGPPEQCRSLGLLLTKTTELLVREQYSELSFGERSQVVRGTAARLLLFHDGSSRELVRHALVRSGIDHPQGQAFVALIRCPAAEDGIAHCAGRLVRRMSAAGCVNLHTYLFPDQYAIITEESGRELLLRTLDGSHPGGGSDENSTEVDNSRLVAGIGDPVPWEELPRSYSQATLALRYAASSGKRVHCYGELTLGTLLSELPGHVRNDYCRQRIGLLSDDERQLLRVYYASELSLKDSAEALFIHKNTLQYRLDRIRDKTGLDPRRFDQSVELYAALLLDHGGLEP